MRRRQFVVASGIAGLACAFAGPVPAQSKVSRVAFLSLGPVEDTSVLIGRLRELGYREGVNLIFESRSAQGDPSRLGALAQELVRTKPDVIVAGFGTLAPQAAKKATASIPIVFAAVGDPVGVGLVASLGRPGANVTGLSAQAAELKGKQLQLLKEIAPGQEVVGVLLNPDTPYVALALSELKAAAARNGTRLELMEVRAPDQFSEPALGRLVAAGARGIIVIEDPVTFSIRARIAELANRLRLPTMTGGKPYVLAGALASYGTDQAHQYRRAAEYVDRILKGEKPGDLPVEQPTRFRLVVNLRTAAEVGLTIPAGLLALVDEVIE